jgi:hypothetical protein
VSAEETGKRKGDHVVALDGSRDRAGLLATGMARGDAAQLETWLAEVAGVALR